MTLVRHLVCLPWRQCESNFDSAQCTSFLSIAREGLDFMYCGIGHDVCISAGKNHLARDLGGRVDVSKIFEIG